MGHIDTDQLLYVAGIGLVLNIIVFTVTLLVYRCKLPRENPDLEAETTYDQSNDDLNAALLDEREKKMCTRLIDLIPAMKFRQVVEERETTTPFVGDGCSICLREGFEEDEVCKVLPECRHVFHSDCIDQWLKTKQSCPVCRKVFRVVVRPVSSFTGN